MSVPPFQVEDQTDADFFDKLVDDDDDHHQFDANHSSLPLEQSLELDDVQAFANLSVNEDFGSEGEDQSKDVIVEKDVLVSEEESVSLVSENLVQNDSGTSGGSGPRSIGVKEVQWSLFNADSAQNSGNGFFADLGDSAVDDPFASIGDNSGDDPFAGEGNNLNSGLASGVAGNVVSDSATSFVSAQHQDLQVFEASTEQTTSGQYLYDSQSWENQYPGWRYDHTSGEWVQVEGYDTTVNSQINYHENAQAVDNSFVSGHKSDVSYLQQTAQSVVGTVAEGCTTGSVSTWNQVQQETTGYPAHMVFDPQYPGWYYDTNIQEWRDLESYNAAIQSTGAAHSQQHQSWNSTNGGFSSEEHSLYGDGQGGNYSPQNLSGQNQVGIWAGSSNNYMQQNVNMWQPETVASSAAVLQSTNMWHPETVAKSAAVPQSTNMWRPETVAKGAATSQCMNVWQPETVAKSAAMSQGMNTWQPETVAKSAATSQGMNLWQLETVAKSAAAPQSMNMWQPETVAKSAAAPQSMNMWQPETVVKSVDVPSSMWQPETVAKSASVSHNMNSWQPETVARSVSLSQNMNMWQPETNSKSDSVAGYTENTKLEKIYGSRNHLDSRQDRQMGFKPINTSMYEQTTRHHRGNGATGYQSFAHSENNLQHFNQPMLEQNQKKLSSHDLYGSQNPGFYSPQVFQSGTQSSYSNVNEGRSSAGRPPHALVSFGFGGKLIVMKDCRSSNSAYGNQEPVGSSISVLNLMDVVIDKSDTTQHGVDDYFRTLCHQSYPGPLVGGSVGAKEVSKWIDERITKCESPNMDYREGELLRLLLSLLKIASQNYGKLRSPFGADPSLKVKDSPEKTVSELFASSRKSTHLSGYGAHPNCLQNVPPESQLWATAVEVQNLLVSGKRMEALQCAQEGQLWGMALQLAQHLGQQLFVDTAKQMAHQMLVAGSPLKTFSLLMAGQFADIFAVDNSNQSGLPGVVNMSRHAQIGPNGMLDDWERNLAIITVNRTKDDELVIINLGDCLWKERGENVAAHMCYLIAEANFDYFSDSARLCLIGADHWKFPRTYASPEAIQRTEFYEYSMVLGNSQSVLLPFQPYKLIYAYMLAEVGRLPDSLKYCQAILKSLKTNRAPEVDAWKQLLSSLEERIKAHQQSGFGTNLATRKLVGKFLPFLDSTIHRMIGPLDSSVPSGNGSEHDNKPVGPRVANSQSTMAMASLIPSESPESLNARGNGGNRTSMHNRSISEPDFGRSPRQVDSSKEASSSDTQGKASDSGGPSRFGRFGSNILQKTMGLVLRPKSDRQAKLGEKNKFYYDEKLKRWVEEGADPPAEEIALPPPPTAAAFQNGRPDYNIKNAFRGDNSFSNGGAEVKSPPSSDRSSGTPPIPPTKNQFSARGRMGVRSRYVDTFNKGNAVTSSFSAPSVAAGKPGGNASAKFFIPTPSPSVDQTAEETASSTQEDPAPQQDPSTLVSQNSFSSPPPQSSPIHRFPSMNNLTPSGGKETGVLDNGNGSLSSRSRRTASWSGSFTGALNPSNINEIKPLGEALKMSTLSSMPSNPSNMHMPVNGGNFGDDLHEVEL